VYPIAYARPWPLDLFLLPAGRRLSIRHRPRHTRRGRDWRVERKRWRELLRARVPRTIAVTSLAATLIALAVLHCQ
jgi:hypothetical protein